MSSPLTSREPDPVSGLGVNATVPDPYNDNLCDALHASDSSSEPNVPEGIIGRLERTGGTEVGAGAHSDSPEFTAEHNAGTPVRGPTPPYTATTCREDSLVALWANELFRSSPVRAPRAILSYDPIDTHLPKANLAEKADVNGAWESAFIPTLLRYLGANTKPWRQWTPTSPGDVYILELIRNAVCGENVYAAAQDYDIYNIAIRCTDEWCDAFGHTAMRVFESFFRSYKGIFADMESRSRYCEQILSEDQLFYDEPEGGRKSGLFLSPFVALVLVGHIQATQGAIHVPGLYADDNVAYPFGAIGLAAAAVYRVALLYRLRMLTYAADGQLRVVQDMIPFSGQEAYADADFNRFNFALKTNQCASLAAAMDDDSVDAVLHCAHAYAGVDLAVLCLIDDYHEHEYGVLVDDEDNVV